MDKIVKVGLIGFGAGGRTFHAPVLTTVPGLQLNKIRATKPDQVSIAKEKYRMRRLCPYQKRFSMIKILTW